MSTLRRLAVSTGVVLNHAFGTQLSNFLYRNYHDIKSDASVDDALAHFVSTREKGSRKQAEQLHQTVRELLELLPLPAGAVTACGLYWLLEEHDKLVACEPAGLARYVERCLLEPSQEDTCPTLDS